jgi:hypothetical protein
MTAAPPLSRLATFDPDLARTLADARRPDAPPLPDAVLGEMVDTILEAYGQALALGEAVADGYQALLEEATPGQMTAYSREIRRTGGRSAAVGRHLAGLLPALLRTGDRRLLEVFQRTLAVLLAKGDYLVKAPLAPLATLAAEDAAAAHDYLNLLQAVFDRPLSYNRCQYLANLLPRAVRGFPASRRRAWIGQMKRLVPRSLDLLEPYLEGLSQGLAVLSAEALHRFVDQALAEASRDAPAARRFLALRANRGRDACRSLQTAATLPDNLARLQRYIAARTGHPGRIRPLSSLGGTEGDPSRAPLQSATDGRSLYLPDTVDGRPTPKDNARLLGFMAKFEVGLLEFGTFTFDLRRARELGCLAGRAAPPDDAPGLSVSDFTVFSRMFDNPRLALDLLTLYEHARVRVRLQRTYPGLANSALPVYQAAWQESWRTRLAPPAPNRLLDLCYGVLALGLAPDEVVPRDAPGRRLVDDLAAEWAACRPESMRVEHSAGLVVKHYDRFREILARNGTEALPLDPPYRLPLRAELIEAACGEAQRQADRLVVALRTCGRAPYRGDLRQLLLQTDGRPRVADILRLPGCGRSGAAPDAAAALLPDHGAADALSRAGLAEAVEDPDDVDHISWYKEWNADIGDYLHDHVRVRDRRLSGGQAGFYAAVLERCAGLVRRIRRSFELLRPEGLALLRQWVEGDDFDYRALLDFALDRKAGRLPSDRLYIKRVKQRRDVAVMLLVDLSRSTSNIVQGSSRSVLDVAKEAVVLFTQALEVVGDAYAVAGFSGTGRLGVDFFRIKDFDEPLRDDVKAAISALTPQRGTRMGGAVRRATRELAARDNRVRLLLMIGDGFPNDTAYKGDYAVQDTRQAIAEARSSGIITQAITVNLPASPRLDALYGPVRHTVISRVDELPDKLLRLYGALTRL